ncbi:hypothetical protein BJX61DRAFT_497872, partial [Aspergillus egyptiacus]
MDWNRSICCILAAIPYLAYLICLCSMKLVSTSVAIIGHGRLLLRQLRCYGARCRGFWMQRIRSWI